MLQILFHLAPLYPLLFSLYFFYIWDISFLISSFYCFYYNSMTNIFTDAYDCLIFCLANKLYSMFPKHSYLASFYYSVNVIWKGNFSFFNYYWLAFKINLTYVSTWIYLYIRILFIFHLFITLKRI